jgi:Sulfotransferase family
MLGLLIPAELAPEDFRRLGERYMTDTRAYRKRKPFFIDKMPNNFRHLGLIHRMTANAKIIDVRREPMACCFSNLKQLFASGQEFTYSIEDIARYYRTYLELMRHWDAVLPGPGGYCESATRTSWRIRNFTGIDDPYEEPLSPEIVVETDKNSMKQCTDLILDGIRGVSD